MPCKSPANKRFKKTGLISLQNRGCESAMAYSVENKVDVEIELANPVLFDDAARVIMHKYGGQQGALSGPVRRLTEKGEVIYPLLIFNASGRDLYYAIDPDASYTGLPLRTKKIILVPRKDGVPTPDFTPESIEAIKVELAGLS